MLQNGNPVTLENKTFHNLTVLELLPLGRNARRSYRCKCKCGKFIDVLGNDIRYGRVRSCGCATPKKDLIGDRFGKLTVLRFVNANGKDRSPRYQVACDCAAIFNVAAKELTKGLTTSCGCDTRSLVRRTLSGTDLQGYKEMVKNKVGGLFIAAMFKAEDKDVYNVGLESSRIFDIIHGIAAPSYRELKTFFRKLSTHDIHQWETNVASLVPEVEASVLSKAGDSQLDCPDLIDTILHNLVNA